MNNIFRLLRDHLLRWQTGACVQRVCVCVVVTGSEGVFGFGVGATDGFIGPKWNWRLSNALQWNSNEKQVIKTHRILNEISEFRLALWTRGVFMVLEWSMHAVYFSRALSLSLFLSLHVPLLVAHLFFPVRPWTDHHSVGICPFRSHFQSLLLHRHVFFFFLLLEMYNNAAGAAACHRPVDRTVFAQFRNTQYTIFVCIRRH